jgi:WD40 repeat protein
MFRYGQPRCSLEMWDARDLHTAASCEIDGPGVRAVALRPDGNTLAVAAARNRSISLIELPALRVVKRSPQLLAVVTALSFSPDGKTLAAGGIGYGADKGGVCLLDADFRVSALFTGMPGGVVSVDFLAGDGHRLAVSSGDRSVRVYDVSDGSEQMVLRGHSEAATGVIPSRDGDSLLSGSSDGTVRLWDARSDPAESRANFTDFSMAFAFSPDSRYLVGGGFEVADLKTGVVRKLSDLRSDHNAIAFTPDGKTLVTGDETLGFWKTADWSLRRQIPIGSTVWSVAVSPDGKLVAVAAEASDAIELRDVATGEIVRTLHPRGRRMRGVSFSPDGRRLLTSTWSTGSSLQMWDMESESDAALYTIDLGATSAVFSPLGDTFAATGRNSSIRIFDAATGKLTNSFIAHTDEIWTLCYSPDGKTIASASWDGTVKLWAASNGALLMTLRQEGQPDVFAVAFSPDGKLLAVNGAGNEARARIYRAMNAAAADDDPEAVRLHALGLKRQRKLGEATRFLRSALERYEKRFGPDDVETARVRLSLADALVEAHGNRDKYLEAEELIARVRKVFASRLPPGHELRWAALFSLRRLYSPDAMNEPEKLRAVQSLIGPVATQPTTAPSTRRSAGQ